MAVDVETITAVEAGGDALRDRIRGAIDKSSKPRSFHEPPPFVPNDRHTSSRQQVTEEEARASFKVLATKYAAVFGDREPYIKRVNIPEKGTFYRANVGPFATSSEANHFCSNLKIVGGQCIVQKN